MTILGTSPGKPRLAPAARNGGPTGGDGTGGSGDGGGGGGGNSRPSRKAPFWRRRQVLVGLAVLLIVAVAVVADLPQQATPASRRADAAATIREISSDVAGCNQALKEAFLIERRLRTGTLTKAQRGQSPGILADDANGCSYTNQSIDDLASLDLPQVSIGKPLNHIAGRVLSWADPDGLTAIDDIASLLSHPKRATTVRSLDRQIAQLRRDRAAAIADERSLAAELHTSLPHLGMRRIVP